MFRIDFARWAQEAAHSFFSAEFRILVRHFLKRLSNFDLVATDTDSRNTAVQILVLLSLPGQILPFWFLCPPSDLLASFLKYQERVFMGFEYYFIGFSMIITGLVIVLNWNSLFPDRQDNAVLSPLPVHPRILFGSKLTALLIFQLSFVVIINLSSTVLFPYFANLRTGLHRSPLGWIFIHALSIGAGNLLMLSGLLCLQGLLLFLTSARLFPKVSMVMQFVVFVLLLTGLLMMLGMEKHLAAFCRGDSNIMQYLPSTWILGLYESLMGRAPSPLAALAPWGCWAVVGTTGGAVLLYYSSYRRHLLNAAASVPEPLKSSWTLPSRAWNLFSRWFFQNPQERALFEFIWKTLCRNRLHQLYLLGYLGTGLAFLLDQVLSLWMVEGWQGVFNSPAKLRAIPLGFSFFVLVGVRMIYTLPAELPANWIFQMANGTKSSFAVTAPRKAMLWQILIPVHLLFFAATWLLQGWDVAFLQGVLNLLIALFLMEWLLGRFNRIPFTAAYQPGKARIHLMWPVYCAGFCTYSFLMALWEDYLMKRPAAFLIFSTLLFSAVVWLRRRALQNVQAQRPLIFDDVPDPVIQVLNLEY